MKETERRKENLEKENINKVNGAFVLQQNCQPYIAVVKSVQDTADSKTIQNNEKAVNFFEGVEKLLEVWFTRAGEGVGTEASDLRNIPRYENCVTR